MAKQEGKNSFDAYQEKKQDAAQTAEKLGIEYDPAKDPEHFQIPICDDSGKEIKRVFLPVTGEISLTDADGKSEGSASIREAVEAIKKFPGESRNNAIRKLRAERSK